MIRVVFGMRGVDEPADLGERVLEHQATMMERALAVRDREPTRFFDVRFDEFLKDNVAVARAIYAHFGLPLSADTEARLQRFADDNPQGKHGSHDYDLDSYGLSAERVRERFADYVARFDL